MLGSCCRVMLVLLELFEDISQHQDVECLGCVIPQFYADVEAAFPIFGEFVFCLEALYSMADVVLICKFHVEVINHQGERNGVCCVSPESWCLFACVVSIWSKTFTQAIC